MVIPAHFWKLYAGKVLETICWEIFWKLYAGKFFGNNVLENFLETVCWEPPDGNCVLGNSGGCRQFFEGRNYGTRLWHHTTVSRQVCKLSIPAAQIFLERCEPKALLEASGVIGRSSKGMGMLNQMLATKVRPQWVSATAAK